MLQSNQSFDASVAATFSLSEGDTGRGPRKISKRAESRGAESKAAWAAAGGGGLKPGMMETCRGEEDGQEGHTELASGQRK